MMEYKGMGVIILISLFFAILLCLKLGRQYLFFESHHKDTVKRADTHLTEGAIFALLGLLIAFSFNSAAEKFDSRRLLIIEEANAIGTAYLRLDLLALPIQKAVKNEMLEYIDSRIQTYEKIPNQAAVAESYSQTQAIEKRIWEKAITGCRSAETPSACIILLPSLNSMFDIANTRMSYLMLHPPIALFIILIGLVLIGSFLAGYSISTAKIGGSLHFLAYACVVAVTITAIIDMEYPRVGFIRVDPFDKVLLDQRTMIYDSIHTLK